MPSEFDNEPDATREQLQAEIDKLKSELDVSLEKGKKALQLQKKLERSEKTVELLRKEFAASLGEKETELERTIALKDDELKHANAEIARKDKVIMELRQRLPRVAEEDT